MISPEKRIILTPLQKLPKNVRDLGKLVVAKGFKKLPKVQKTPNLVTLHCMEEEEEKAQSFKSGFTFIN